MNTPEKNQMLFVQLISMFHAASMQHMGKIKNPMTEKIEKKLDEAQISIDILDMLKEKCKNNLSSEEEKFLQNVIQELKLNFVEEQSKK